MKFAFFTNCISPHQLPLAKLLIDKLGIENYRYIYTDVLTKERQRMGWGDAVDVQWCQQGNALNTALQKADVVMSGVRSIDLFEARLKEGKLTLYCSERWFKPPLGFLRVFVPSYLKMALRFVQCLKNNAFTYLSKGIHAARDMARLVGFLNGDLRCLFRAPKVAFESRPGGVIVPLEVAIKEGVLSKEEISFGEKHGFVQIPREHWGNVKPQRVYAKMRMWGYFVAPSNGERYEIHEKGEFAQWPTANNSKPLTDALRLRVLWVGRMLDWKRVDTLVKACVADALKDRVELHLYGHGPEEEKLKRLATAGNNVFFHDFVPVAQVRDLMRAHDVYVLPSDGGEGWGAVINEALEEGMKVLGTTGAGSSATILPPTHLFKAGDVKRLTELLMAELPKVAIGEWTVENAVKRLDEIR